jgi:AbrB family looped-hinge helix DNA binding protein
VKKKEEFEGMFYGSATVGTKGQVVIPAKLRKDFKIKPGDALVFIGRTKHGFHIMKPEELLRLQKEFEKLQKLVKKIKKR